MKEMPDVGIDWLEVSWFYVAVLTVFVFLAALIGNLLSFNHRVTAAFLSALLFAAIFVFWTYYPHNLPLPTSISREPALAEPSGMPKPAEPASPVKPRNPITDITPPAPANPQ